MSDTVPAARTAQQPGAARLPHLDTLRMLLVAWVIGGHALLGYSAVGGWAYDEVNEVTFAPATEWVLVAVLGPSGLFVIGLLFFVSGLLAGPALARRGPRRYVRDRALHLGLPWLVSALLLWPAAVWLAYTAAGRDVSFGWVLGHRDPLLDSGALWFALVLLLYSAAFAVWRGLVGPPRTPAGPVTGAHLVGAVTAIAVASFVVRLWFPARSGQIGDLHLWQWPQCAGLFALGVAVGARGWGRHVPDRVRRACGVVLAAALVALPALAMVTGLRDVARDAGPYLGGWHWQAAATAAMEATLVVAGAVWLVGLAERRLGTPGPWAVGRNRGAFGAFVVQGPVLMVLAAAARALEAPAEVKAPLVGAAGLWVCFWLGRHVPVARGTRSPATGPAGGRQPGRPDGGNSALSSGDERRNAIATVPAPTSRSPRTCRRVVPSDRSRARLSILVVSSRSRST